MAWEISICRTATSLMDHCVTRQNRIKLLDWKFLRGGGILLHEFETDTPDGAALNLIETVALEQQKELLRPESQYNENAYEDFFRKNRIKRKITPIFYTYDDSIGNKLRTSLCVWKINAIRVLKQYRDKHQR